MSLAFETTLNFDWSMVPVQVPPIANGTPQFIIKANEVAVWVGWSNGKITSHTSLHLEYTLEQSYYFDNQTISLPHALFGEGESGSACATKWYDTIYVLTGTTVRGYNIHTNQQVTSFSCPHNGSDLVAAAGRLWVSGSTIASTMQNELHSYDIAAETWTTYTIPKRHQTQKRVLVDGLDGKLWITMYNNHSIVPFDLATNTFGTVRVINRHPRNFAVNQNKQLFVLSEDVTSLFNQSTNVSTQFCANLGHTTILDDLRTGFMWWVGGGKPTYRMVKSNVSVVEAGASGVQTDDIYDQVAVLTNQVTYDKYDPSTGGTASITIRPYLFIKTGTGIVAYRATALKGVNSSQIQGTGMVALGPHAYIGT